MLDFDDELGTRLNYKNYWLPFYCERMCCCLDQDGFDLWLTLTNLE